MNLFKKITLLFCLITMWSSGQISFYNSYSDEGYDVGEGIVQLPDSSYLVTGSSSSFSSSAQAFIMQVDSLGNRLWSKSYGGSESDKGRRIFHVPNDGIYVAGQSNSFGNFHDVYFFKTDLSGNLMYEKNYGSTSYENIHDGVMLTDTSFILVGETYNTSNESENIYLLRLNKHGDTLWTKNFGSEQKDVARTIKLLNDTTVIIGGEYFVTDSLTQKAMLIKMDIDGTIAWLKTYGNYGKHVLNDLTIENGSIRAVGYNYNEMYVEGFTRNFLLKCDLDGLNDIKITEFHNGNFSIQCITHFSQNPDNYYFCLHGYDSPDVPTNPDGKIDIIINKFTADLYYNGVSFIPSNSGDDITNEIIATSDGGAIAVGSNQKLNIGGSNVLLMKIGVNDDFQFSYAIPYNSTLVSVKEQINNAKFQIYPNPTVNFISIDNIELIGTTYIVYNNFFKEIVRDEIKDSKINLEKLPSGSYFISLGNSIQQFIKL